MKLLFIVGPHASGKTYSTNQYLNNNKDGNIVSIDTGPIMRKLHKESDPNIHISEWVNKLEEQYGKNVTSSLIAGEINKIIVQGNYDNAILIGYRTIDSISYLIQALDIQDFHILYVDASYELLYNNYLKREKKEISFSDFEIYLNEELKSGLIKLKDLAMNHADYFEYFYKTSNEDSFENVIVDFFELNKSYTKRKKI